MRILHINCNYIGTVLHQTMIEHLDKLGVENHVFVPTYNKDAAVLDVNNNVIISECFKKWDRLVFDYKSLKIRNSVKKNYNIGGFDLIHAYTLFTDGNVAYRLNKESGIPYVVAIRNTDVNSFLKYMVFLRPRAIKIMKNAKAVFFLSQAYKAEVFQKYIPSTDYETIEAKSYIIPNGIDDYWFYNLYINRKPYINNKPLEIIYVGNIDKNKNLETTQRSLDILRKKTRMEVNYTIIGKVIDYSVFKKIGADRYTTYIKPQPKEVLLRYYREADIFVMPSHKETFGLVYAEAMSQGLPVVYTAGQGFDEQFPEGTVGYRVDDKNPESIAKAILLIVKNYRFHMDECNKNVVKFKWDSICQEYFNCYKSILNESK